MKIYILLWVVLVSFALVFSCELRAQTWQYVTTEFLDGDTFGDSVALVVGRHGVIYRISRPPGEEAEYSVSLPLSHTVQNFRAVVTLGDRFAVVGGDGGVLLRSSDQGKSWIRESLGVTESIAGFAHSEAELITYTKSMLFSSRDTGETWRQVSIPGKGIADVEINGTSVGFLLDTLGSLYRTTDAGNTWDSFPWDFSDTPLHDIEFNSGYGVGVIAGGGSNAFLSTDSGRTWEHVVVAQKEIELLSAIVHDDGSITVAGEVPQKHSGAAAVYRSVDTGRTWSPIRTDPTFNLFRVNDLTRWGEQSFLALANQGRLYAVERDSAALDTITDTRHWFDMFGPSISNAVPGTGPKGVAIYGSQTDGGGVFHRTETFGITWQRGVVRPDPITGFEMFDNGEGLATASRSLDETMYTSDTGVTWSVYRTEVVPDISGIRGRIKADFQTRDSGVALVVTGADGEEKAYFYTSQDGGRSFHGTVVDSMVGWTDIAFPLPHAGLVSGLESKEGVDSSERRRYHGAIIRTTDRGRTWEAVFRKRGNFGYPSAPVMLSENEYLAAVDGGSVGESEPYALVKTENGGKTWRSVATAPSLVTDIAAFSDSVLFAVGWLGYIAKSTDRGETWERYEFDIQPFDTLRQGSFEQAVLPNFEHVGLLSDRQTALITGNSAVLRARFDVPFPPLTDLTLSVEREGEPVRSRDSGIIVFPNPVQYLMYLDLDSEIDERFSVQLHDPVGKLVFSRHGITSEEGISVISVAAGTYYLTVLDANGRRLGIRIVTIVR